MANEPLRAEVVSAEGLVWEGEAISVIARTTEGDIGVMARHEPFIAPLVPCAAEILTPHGDREFLAVDGGFISVDDNRVAVIAQYAQIAREIKMEVAENELAKAEKALDDGDESSEAVQRRNRAFAQVRAAYKAAGKGL